MGHRHIPAPGAATSAVTGWGFANPGWGAETRRGRPSFPLIVRSRRVRVSRAAALAPAPRGTAAFGGAVAARTRHLRRPQDSFRKSGPGEFAGSQKMQRGRHLATEARGTRPRRAAGVRAESTCSGPAASHRVPSLPRATAPEPGPSPSVMGLAGLSPAARRDSPGVSRHGSPGTTRRPQAVLTRVLITLTRCQGGGLGPSPVASFSWITSLKTLCPNSVTL